MYKIKRGFLIIDQIIYFVRTISTKQENNAILKRSYNLIKTQQTVSGITGCMENKILFYHREEVKIRSRKVDNSGGDFT